MKLRKCSLAAPTQAPHAFWATAVLYRAILNGMRMVLIALGLVTVGLAIVLAIEGLWFIAIPDALFGVAVGLAAADSMLLDRRLSAPVVFAPAAEQVARETTRPAQSESHAQQLDQNAVQQLGHSATLQATPQATPQATLVQPPPQQASPAVTDPTSVMAPPGRIPPASARPRQHAKRRRR